MSLDTVTPRSRRVILAGAIGAAAATVASALGRPAPVRAGSDGDVVLGSDANVASTLTKITNSANATPVFQADSVDGIALQGSSASSVGVYGTSTTFSAVYGASSSGNAVLGVSQTGMGVYGKSLAPNVPAVASQSIGDSTGVMGFSGAGGLPIAPGYTGVYGYAAQNVTAVGVMGETVAGNAVLGRATGTTGYTGGVAGLVFSPEGAASWGWADPGTGAMGISGPTDPGAGRPDTGVYGIATHTTNATVGVLGVVPSPAGSGVIGYSGTGAPPAPKAKTGVFGQANQGIAGVGVRGHSTSGTGVYGSSSTGYGLRVDGRVRLTNCAGSATVPSGAKSVVVTPGIDLTASSIVTATLMGSAGGTTTVHRVSVDTAGDTFTIHLTANSSVNVKVGWHVFG